MFAGAKAISARQVGGGVALPGWVEALLEVDPGVVYLVAFVAAFGESAPAIGLLVPGQSILVGAGFIAAQGEADPVVLAALVAVGGFLGDTLGYAMGRAWGVSPLQRLPGKLRLTDGGRARLASLFDGHGMKAVMLARFQPIGRAFGPYLAGASGMTLPRFLAAAALASVLAAAGLVGLGYLAGLGFERLSRALGITAVVVVTLLLAIVVWIGLRLRKHPHGRAPPPDGPGPR
jgi:membrane protein DedA with SNARE-associated domain